MQIRFDSPGPEALKRGRMAAVDGVNNGIRREVYSDLEFREIGSWRSIPEGTARADS